MTIQLIVGLGNPGPQYAQTRHNVGVWFVQQLARQTQVSFKEDKKFHGQHAVCSHADQKVHLLWPNTFMNHSGRAVQAIANFYKLPPQAILVAHDDLDLPAGVCKLKTDGGHGGHNGLRDIISQLGSQAFHRVRIGIGHPGHRDRVLNYVLGKPSATDKEHIDHSIDDVLSVMDWVLAGQMQPAMNRLHARGG